MYAKEEPCDAPGDEGPSKVLVLYDMDGTLRQGDGLAEGMEGGPFDAILVGGSLPTRNPGLERRLKVGGRMVAVIGEAPVMQMCLITREGESEWHCEPLFETELVPLENAGAGARFLF